LNVSNAAWIVIAALALLIGILLVTGGVVGG
jgi:hypothetical protein